MPVDLAYYHGWHGQRVSPWWAVLAMIRVSLRQVFRRKMYWIALALGLLQFLLFAATIYIVTQLPLPDRALDRIYQLSGFSPEANVQGESGYIRFIESQQTVAMVLLAFAGSLLVGADFRQGSLPFYLSRGINRIHYIIGKIMAVGTIVLLLTAAPATLLFIEYGLFTESLDYWINNMALFGSIWVYSLIWAAVLSILLVSLGSYLTKTAPLIVVWAALFTLLPVLATELSKATGNQYWKLLDLWRNLRYSSLWLFGRETEPLTPYSVLVLVVLCIVMLTLLARRVRAVEVVQ